MSRKSGAAEVGAVEWKANRGFGQAWRPGVGSAEAGGGWRGLEEAGGGLEKVGGGRRRSEVVGGGRRWLLQAWSRSQSAGEPLAAPAGFLQTPKVRRNIAANLYSRRLEADSESDSQSNFYFNSNSNSDFGGAKSIGNLFPSATTICHMEAFELAVATRWRREINTLVVRREKREGELIILIIARQNLLL